VASVRTQKEIRQRAPIWLVALLVTNLVIMAVDARDAEGRHKVLRVWTQTFASPLQTASSKASGATTGFFQQIWNFRSTAQQNEQLQERLTQVEQELNIARQATAENERLRSLLDLNEKLNIQTIPARVIARDPSVWFNTITINRGTSSGIATNMPVVTAGGIVGRVITVSPWASQVMLITDEKAGAGAVVGQLGESGALGSVRGRADLGVALIEMRYVSGL
jgi:rod shape-determining protein MreC